MGNTVMDDQAKLHLAQVEFDKQEKQALEKVSKQVEFDKRVKEMREEDIKDLDVETAVRLNSLMARTRTHPVDHTLIRCGETPKMVLIAKQIADLQAEYDKLREQEQRSQFAAFLRLFRQKFGNRNQKTI